MAGSTVGRLRLADYLTGLRSEMTRARAQAGQDDLGFGVDIATAEIDIAFSLDPSGQLDFWVQGSTAGEEREPASGSGVQRVTVRLTPRAPAPTDVATVEPGTAVLPRTFSREYQVEDVSANVRRDECQ